MKPSPDTDAYGPDDQFEDEAFSMPCNECGIRFAHEDLNECGECFDCARDAY